MAAGQTACRQCGRSFEPYGRARRSYCKQCSDRADRAIAQATVVQCKECGKRFSTPSRSFRYCSDACRTEAVRRGRREYQRRSMADPKKRAVILARMRALTPARTAREGGGRPAPSQAKAPPRAGRNAGPSTCGLCGRTFAPYGRARHAYCKRCTARADRDLARTLRVRCKACGKRFSTTSRNVRYCSNECRAEGARHNRRESRRRRMADPEKRAVALAYVRAWQAARKARGRGGAAS